MHDLVRPVPSVPAEVFESAPYCQSGHVIHVPELIGQKPMLDYKTQQSLTRLLLALLQLIISLLDDCCAGSSLPPALAGKLFVRQRCRQAAGRDWHSNK